MRRLPRTGYTALNSSDMEEIVPEESWQEEWKELRSGGRVWVTAPRLPGYSATVDDKTEDSRFVWIVDDSGLRRVFGHREGVRIFPLADGASVSGHVSDPK
jgi:hypothetical protein